MLRNVFIVLVLAALAATSAAAASPDVPAIAHKPVPPKIAHRKPARQVAPKASHRGSVQAKASVRSPRVGRSGSSRSRRNTTTSAHLSRTRAGRVPARASLKTVSLERNSFVASPRQRNLVRGVSMMPSPLKGSFESLARQNERTEADGLERILDEDDLASRIQQKLLVPIPTSSALAVNENLTENHRYCRPWTAAFLSDLASDHASRFHRPLLVSSAVRTVEYQQRLMRTNGNAAAAEGDVVSPHLTGGTIDIPKQGMNRQELGWMRNWLLAQQLAGTIDVEEEFKQSCFHITVYKNYSSSPSTAPIDRVPRQGASPVNQVASDGTSDKPTEQ